MKKKCYCYTFYKENHTYVPVQYITSNKKILFVKKYISLMWLFTDFSILLLVF